MNSVSPSRNSQIDSALFDQPLLVKTHIVVNLPIKPGEEWHVNQGMNSELWSHMSSSAFCYDLGLNAGPDATVSAPVYCVKKGKVIEYKGDDDSASREGNRVILKIDKTRGQAFAAMNILSTGAESNPRGDISLSVVWFAKQEAEGNTDEVDEILSRTSPPPEQAVTRLVTLALHDSTGMINAKMILDQTADSIRMGTQQPVSGKITDVLQRVSLGNQQPVSGKITAVLQQIVLEAALIGGRTPAQTSLNGIAEEVAGDTGGPLSRIIFSIAQLQENGEVNRANDIILAIAARLSEGGKVSEIPYMFEFTNTTEGSPEEDSSLGSLPLPNFGGDVQPPPSNGRGDDDGKVEGQSPERTDGGDVDGNIAGKFAGPTDDDGDVDGNIAGKFAGPTEGDDDGDGNNVPR